MKTQISSDKQCPITRKTHFANPPLEAVRRNRGTVTVIHAGQSTNSACSVNYGHCPFNSGELPRALAHSRNSQCPPAEILCQHSALSAAYPLLGWLPAVRFIPCKGYAADKAWAGHERLESASLCVTLRTAPVKSSLSFYNLFVYIRSSLVVLFFLQLTVFIEVLPEAVQ